MSDTRLSRRAFLKKRRSARRDVCRRAAIRRGAETARPVGKSVNADEVGGFIAIDAKGTVTIYSGKVDLGTGAITAITQIAAEELSVPFGRVTTIQGDTLLTPNQGPTYASLTIQNGGMQIRRAAATARDALLDQAADKSQGREGHARRARRRGHVPRRRQGSFLRAARRRSKADDQGRSCGAAEGPEGLHDRRHVRCLDSTFRRKIFGTFNFIQDVKLPGMLHARVIHPAASARRSKASNDTACRKIPGYVRAVRKGNFLAVVATNEWAAIRASTAIVAKWSAWAGLPEESQAVRIRAQLEGRSQRSIPEHGRHGRRVQGRVAERCRRRTTSP